MRPILFHAFGVAIPSFWTMVFLGFLAGFLAIRSEVQRRGYSVAVAYDVTLWAYVGGWVGARLFLIPTGWNYFVQDPIAFLLSSSGWVWYGGLIGGTVAVLLWARRERMPWLVVADIVAPGLAIGLAFGRIGCQLAGDGDYGVPTSLPWGMSYPNGVVPTTERVHPAPIYEMLALLALFAYLWRRRLANPPAGDLIGRYLVATGVIRLSIEFVRRNPAWLLGLTTAQWMSIGSIAIGAWILRRLDATSASEEASTPPASSG
jgi:phosphatidylglycerol---prolipoprotein diacylglyceryl transferase